MAVFELKHPLIEHKLSNLRNKHTDTKLFWESLNEIAGLMVYEAAEAAKLLEKEGIKARVINMSTIKPLDEETVLKAAKECKFIVTSEEHSVIGGLGGAVSEFLSETYPTKVIKHGVYDEFGQSADGDTMLNNYKLRAKDIVEIILKNNK